MLRTGSVIETREAITLGRMLKKLIILAILLGLGAVAAKRLRGT